MLKLQRSQQKGLHSGLVGVFGAGDHHCGAGRTRAYHSPFEGTQGVNQLICLVTKSCEPCSAVNHDESPRHFTRQKMLFATRWSTPATWWLLWPSIGVGQMQGHGFGMWIARRTEFWPTAIWATVKICLNQFSKERWKMSRLIAETLYNDRVPSKNDNLQNHTLTMGPISSIHAFLVGDDIWIPVALKYTTSKTDGGNPKTAALCHAVTNQNQCIKGILAPDSERLQQWATPCYSQNNRVPPKKIPCTFPTCSKTYSFM